MKRFFVLNGDADGLCALQQLYLHEAFVAAGLVAGAKRDTRLVHRVAAARGDEVTVLDLSFEPNAEAVRELLEAGVRVRYFDHHHAGELPVHPDFQAFIDGSPSICTSLLVDRYLNGAQRLWAITGAFGDNLEAVARALAAQAGVSAPDADTLARLGRALNYNAYGETEADLFFHPLDLHRRLAGYADPLAFAASDPAFETLSSGYTEDLEHAANVAPVERSEAAALYLFPDAKWARRVSGVFANQLVREAPRRAHAIAVPIAGGGYTISVRAPQERPYGAVTLCRQFATGGGRESAAGINRLPEAEIESFRRAFFAQFGG